MISKQLNDALFAIAQLTQSEQERLIAFMQSPPSVISEPAKVTPKPMPPIEPQKIVEPSRRKSQEFLHWSDEDTLILMQFEEESKTMSAYERRRKQKQLCRQFGRSASAVKNKLWKIRNGVK